MIRALAFCFLPLALSATALAKHHPTAELSSESCKIYVITAGVFDTNVPKQENKHMQLPDILRQKGYQPELISWKAYLETVQKGDLHIGNSWKVRKGKLAKTCQYRVDLEQAEFVESASRPQVNHAVLFKGHGKQRHYGHHYDCRRAEKKAWKEFPRCVATKAASAEPVGKVAP